MSDLAVVVSALMLDDVIVGGSIGTPKIDCIDAWSISSSVINAFDPRLTVSWCKNDAVCAISIRRRVSAYSMTLQQQSFWLPHTLVSSAIRYSSLDLLAGIVQSIFVIFVNAVTVVRVESVATIVVAE